MKIIDIGVNLMHRSFDIDRENVVDDALFEGVSPLIITGTSEKSSVLAAKYASKYPKKLYCTAGIHPHDAKNCTDKTIEKLRDLTTQPCVVAVGECGLDYNRDFSPRDIQRKIFIDQIQLAIETNLPLFLHERDAFDDFSSIIGEYRKEVKNMVVHCFTGNQTALEKYIELGCYIGITGWICDERRGRHLIDLIKLIPQNKLMIETDAPFLTPRNMVNKPRDGRNEPQFLVHILDELATYLDLDSEDLADITYNNTKSFFNLDK